MMKVVTKIEPYDAVVKVATFDAVEANLGQPHSPWRLPGQTWTDMLVCLMVSLVAPFQNVGMYPISRDPHSNPLIDKIRNMIEKAGPSAEKAACEQWAASLTQESTPTTDTTIIEVVYMIPRRLMLQEWGLLQGDMATMTKDQILPAEDIEILLRFPASVYLDMIDTSAANRNDFGCISLPQSSFDLKKLDTGNVPLIVFFHGGGLIVGSNHEETVLELAGKLGSSIILASVKYSLAPEYPFPAAGCDACTVVTHFLDGFSSKDHTIHIMGSSGGTQPAAVSTFECFRRYPGRIASCHLMLPMLQPASDSVSHYLNGRASRWITTESVRWLWCAYLQLPLNSSDDDDNDSRNTTASDRLTRYSNRDTWDTWCETHRGRLVDPSFDLPNGLDQPSAPAVLIHTNSGDPIRDDGATFVETLRSVGARVHHNEDPGAHWWGTKLGTSGGMDKLAAAWRDVLFPDKEGKKESSN
jgi:acetyl esterase/lipase